MFSAKTRAVLQIESHSDCAPVVISVFIGCGQTSDFLEILAAGVAVDGADFFRVRRFTFRPTLITVR